MAYRIFISLGIIICAYLAFETVRYKFLQHSLFNTEAEYVLGDPDGDVTFVKFLDYNCQFCRDAHPIVTEAVRRDGNVKFLPRPIAILGAEDISASLLPYAAAKQGKFSEMHEALLRNGRALNDQVIQDLSLEIGIDPEQLKSDLADNDVIKQAKKNLALFKKYRLQGTPSYAIGKDIVFTPNQNFDADDFINLFNEARDQ